jgi:hypothetical protein
VTVIVPEVGSAHVGAVDVAVTVGAVVGALIVAATVASHTPATLLVTDTV